MKISNINYNQYCIIKLNNGLGKLVLCSLNTETKEAFQFDQYGNQTLREYYNFIVDHYPDSDEIQNYLDQNKI